MSAAGYRSIEIEVSNNLNAKLIVCDHTAVESWIDEEHADIGHILRQGYTTIWGVSTVDTAGAATLSVQLTGLGGLVIQATNDADGRSSVRFLNVSPEIEPRWSQAGQSTAHHGFFYVELNPSTKS